MNILSKICTVILLSVSLFTVNAYAQPQTSAGKSGNDFEISKNLDVFITMFQELNQNYVDEIRPGELIETGINALLNDLDPYTNFIPESEIEDYEMMTTGQYGGIGALIQKRGDYVIISEPYEGAPAYKAGIMAGDKIIEVNGKSAKGKSVEDISSALKGQPGTPAVVVVQRDGVDKPIEKSIIREKVKIPNIPYSGVLKGNIGYIKLNSFTQNAGEEVKEAFSGMRDSANIKGLILDLRGNGGGLLNEAVNIVNIFVKRGELIVSTKGRIKEKNQLHRTTANPVDTEIPLVVLVDKSSASASEIVAGSLQDLDRAVIVGQMTYGKGLVQNVFPLTYNTRIKITVAKYYIPSGRCIQKIDYSHKDDNGDSPEIPDSLRSAFKTAGGRIVYDGVGIEPDILLDEVNYSNISISLISKHCIFDYATKFRKLMDKIAEPSDFIVTDSVYNDFIKFISDKDYDYTTKSEKSLEELRKNAEKEKYFSAIESEFNALKQKMIHDKKDDLIKFKKEISSLIRQEIASRYYFQRGRIITSLDDDPEVRKAIDLLSDQALYKSILNGTYNKQKN